MRVLLYQVSLTQEQSSLPLTSITHEVVVSDFCFVKCYMIFPSCRIHHHRKTPRLPYSLLFSLRLFIFYFTSTALSILAGSFSTNPNFEHLPLEVGPSCSHFRLGLRPHSYINLSFPGFPCFNSLTSTLPRFHTSTFSYFRRFTANYQPHSLHSLHSSIYPETSLIIPGYQIHFDLLSIQLQRHSRSASPMRLPSYTHAASS